MTLSDPSFKLRYKRFMESMDRAMADVIAEAWQRAQVYGLTHRLLARQLNWSIYRVKRTMAKPATFGSVRATCKLMTFLGLYGFKTAEFERAPSFDFNMMRKPREAV